ncbi:hypothetical protein XU18_3512 [Perkinsela sp. CCAP 1560/4]|nr:hypothetical protein XU18_3512 [Perkinsela sp. CCAP 1560/4]|eukprot:KNH05541.1 hypothetical protein XU18_3512 [Perkinsela sp. CCAP 1560/4]
MDAVNSISRETSNKIRYEDATLQVSDPVQLNGLRRKSTPLCQISKNSTLFCLFHKKGIILSKSNYPCHCPAANLLFGVVLPNHLPSMHFACFQLPLRIARQIRVHVPSPEKRTH